jgi:hypothetical protein
MFSVCVCAFSCVCVQVEALRRADHPSKDSYRLSLIKKLRKLSPMLQSGSKFPSVGATRKKKKSRREIVRLCAVKCYFYDVFIAMAKGLVHETYAGTREISLYIQL